MSLLLVEPPVTPRPLGRRLLIPILLRLLQLRGGEIGAPKLRGLIGPPAPDIPEVRGARFSESDLGGVPAERIEAGGTVDADVLFVHGGAYMAGTAAGFRRVTGALTRDIGARGWSIDYRLAPEHPFPAAVEDGLAAYQALLETGSPAARVVLCGESAGGGIALATVLSARDAGLPLPGALLLFCPSTDLTLSGESLRYNRGRDALTMGLMTSCTRIYLAGADPRNPLASPLFADLTGFPPTFIQVGSNDMVRSDSERLADALDAAGVDVRLELWQGKMHAFAGAGDTEKDAAAALANATQWVRGTLDGAAVAATASGP